MNLDNRLATPRGLSSTEAALRLQRDGPNQLPHPEQRRWPEMVAEVMREPMVLLLLGAAALYWVVGDATEAALLAVSVILVIALTLVQTLRSEQALQRLRDLSSPRARVLRDGEWLVLPATELVLGDVLQMAEGDRVPADARILLASDLQIDQSLLTGESLPVAMCAAQNEKDEEAIAHAGTLIVRGHASAVVVATGARTAMGKIGASLVVKGVQRTPLQIQMRHAVMVFAMIGLASCVAMVLLYAWLRGDWLQALLAGITLAISNIPEEFPVVLTVFLALGGWRMAQQRVLVRRPPVIETLGAVTVLCTDKTGTLTENKIALKQVWFEDGTQSLTDALQSERARTLLQHAWLASASGTHDPIDLAIHAALSDHAVSHQLRADVASVKDYPCSPALPAYLRVWQLPNEKDWCVACKGAPETVAGLCVMSDAERARILAAVTQMAQDGWRVLGVARATWPIAQGPLPSAVSALQHLPFQWLGLLGLADPLRASVPDAMQQAQQAGIRVIMVTGDHLETARAIADAAGLDRAAAVQSGPALDALPDSALTTVLNQTQVFARVRPEHKLRLVQAWKQNGEVVAMTGDGVNDAPALMAAHVGIAMGGRGTDVAREAASIVLLDDDFSSIVRAIRMGRTIYANICRAVRYIIAVHVPITGLALFPLLSGQPLILMPLHVVFLELIIDPACSIVFEREPVDERVMHDPPRDTKARLINARVLLDGLLQGLLALMAVLWVMALARQHGQSTAQQAALAFAALVVGNLALIVTHRSGTRLLDVLLRPNLAYWVVVGLALFSLAIVILMPGPARWFGFATPAHELLSLALIVPMGLVLLGDALIRHFRGRHWIAPTR